ncbi:MAG: SDR family oxidoreductase [Acidobacteriota bacterium]|nr:SDR family oxidoreductase [Acidobacteriota bacterium]
MPARNVIVTGGSRGLGLGIVRKLLESGFHVIAVARSKSDALRELEETARSGGQSALRFVACDLGELEQIPALVKRIREEAGPIFGLVNNAGISAEGVLGMMPDADIERMVRVNTLSPILVTKHVVRSMMAVGGGSIVHIASVVALTGFSGLAAYSATKASLVGFTRSLAREVGRLGIRVNAVAPGFIATDMTQSMTEEARKSIERRSALKRMAEAEDIANGVEFLLSDRSRNITGTILTIDAGGTA